MRKAITCALTLALLALPLFAEVGGSPAISVTSTSATVTLPQAASSVRLINNSSSANKLFARLFVCGEATAAAVADVSPIRIEPGESFGYTFNGRTEGTAPGTSWGYCAFSYVTAAAETATLRYQLK
jgi:hypothetical protein